MGRFISDFIQSRTRFFKSFTSVFLLVFSALSLGGIYSYQLTKQEQHFIEIDFSTDRSGLIQVFWNSGDGFNPRETSLNSIRVRDHRTKVLLNAPEVPFDDLRFDPNNAQGHFELFGFRFVNGKGDVIGRDFDVSQFRVQSGLRLSDTSEGLFRFEMTNNDPIILVDVPEETKLLLQEKKHLWLQYSFNFLLSFLVCFGLLILIGDTLFPVLCAWLIWMVFYPGLFSPDSIDQVEQAFRGTYHNWHPPILSIVLRGLLQLGFDVGVLSLLQLQVGFLGLFQVVRNLIRIFELAKHNIINSDVKRLIPVIVVFLLLLPVTPYASFFCIYWKDVWIAIVMLWIVNLSLVLLITPSSRRTIWRDSLKGVCFVLLTLCSVAFRYNSIVLIPIYCGLVFSLFSNRNFVFRILLVGTILFSVLNYKAVLNQFFEINDKAPQQSVMALELTGLLYRFPEVANDVPLTVNNLVEGYEEHFKWAGYRYMYHGRNPYAKRGLVKPHPNAPLKEEYFNAVRKHFWKMCYVKWMNFAQLMDPRKTTEWSYTRITTNKMGIEFDRTFDSLRRHYRNLLQLVHGSGFYRWISGVYLPWFILNFVILIWLFLRFAEKRCVNHFCLMLISLIPIGYTFSYYLACVWKAFRYIAPSMILVQVFVLTYLLFFGALAVQKRFPPLHSIKGDQQ